MSIVGINEDALEYIEKSELKQNVLLEGRVRQFEDIRRWFEQTIDYLVCVNNFSFSITFGGRATHGDLVVFTIDSETKTIEQLYCDNGAISYSFNGSPYISKEFIEDNFKRLYTYYDGSLETMLHIQSLLNDLIADNDHSVNKVKKYFCLS